MNTLTVCCFLVCLTLPVWCDTDTREQCPPGYDVCDELKNGVDEITMLLQQARDKLSHCEPCTPAQVSIHYGPASSVESSGKSIAWCPEGSTPVSCSSSRDDERGSVDTRSYRVCLARDSGPETEPVVAIATCKELEEGTLTFEDIDTSSRDQVLRCPDGTRIGDCSSTPYSYTDPFPRETIIDVTANTCRQAHNTERRLLQAACWKI